MKAKRLQRGDSIGLLSPCLAYSQEQLEPAAGALRARGYEVVIAPNACKSTYGYAASPEERAADFNAMIADPSIRMLSFGGGEVCNEILPLVDFEAVRRNPKLLCSYSDSTTILNAVQSLTGLET